MIERGRFGFGWIPWPLRLHCPNLPNNWGCCYLHSMARVVAR